jgi:hypothetical protein
MKLQAICSLLFVVGCTSSDRDCPPDYVPLFYARFAVAGGVYSDTSATLTAGELLRLDSVLRFYGDTLGWSAAGERPCIPESLARDTTLLANFIVKAFDESWLEKHIRARAGMGGRETTGTFGPPN